MCFRRRVQLLAPKELYVRYNAHMMNKPWHPRNTKFGSCWRHKYNTNTYFVKCIFPNPAPEGCTETVLLTCIPQVLAWYIQYQHIFSKLLAANIRYKYIFLKMYIPQLCARRAHRNPPTYIYPPNVGMIYPIPTHIFNWLIFPKLLAAHIQCKYTFSKMYIP